MLLLAAALALLAGPAPALDPSRPPHAFARTIFREELPQASVLALVQSTEGYLWLGTYEGLVRFDGEEFQVWDRQTFPAMRTNFPSVSRRTSRGESGSGRAGEASVA